MKISKTQLRTIIKEELAGLNHDVVDEGSQSTRTKAMARAGSKAATQTAEDIASQLQAVLAAPGLNPSFLRIALNAVLESYEITSAGTIATTVAKAIAAKQQKKEHTEN